MSDDVISEKRARSEPPPTMAFQAYQSLDPFVRRAFTITGMVLSVFFAMFPIVMEGVFERDLWIGLWLIDYGVALPVSFVMVAPPLGFKLLGILPDVLTKLLPERAKKLLSERPDRRASE